jgi:hypothetical protein
MAHITAKPPELTVPPDDPFKHDALDRRGSATILTQFVRRLRGPYVLGIDSAWGSGKTTFLQMWMQSMTNDGVECLYFNAWETDFSNDPFTALTAELTSSLQKLGGSDTTAQKHIRRARRIASVIAKRAVPAVIRIGTAGVLDLDKDIEKEVSAVAGELASDQIEAYSKSKKSLSAFRAALTKTVQTLSPPDKPPQPIVIVIDELDRCRPPYAIELLEKVKHLFSIPGIVFIIAIDRAQLLHSICSVYGSGFGAAGYLRRFIDMDYQLPPPPPSNYVRFLFDKLGIHQHFESRPTQTRHEDLDVLRSLVERLVGVVGFSLREQAQCVSRLFVVLNTIPDDHWLFAPELAILTVLREWNVGYYNDFRTGRIDHRVIINELKKTQEGHVFFKERLGFIVEAALMVWSAEVSGDRSVLTEFETLPPDFPDDAARERAIEMRGLLSTFSQYDRKQGMKHTFTRLALAQNFITRPS